MADIKNNLSATTDPSAANDSSQAYAVGSFWFRKDTGVVWQCTDATASAAIWTRVNFDDRHWPSQTFTGSRHVTTYTASVASADLLTMVPFTMREKTVCDGIAVWLATAQTGAECRLGIYRADPLTGEPTTRKVDAGIISLASGSGMKTITISQFFDPGKYWLAAAFATSGVMPTIHRVGNAVAGEFGLPAATNPFGTTIHRYLSAAFTYGALPSTAPAMTPDTGSFGVGVALRRA